MTAGRIVLVTGGNGAGKTRLLRQWAGLQPLGPSPDPGQDPRRALPTGRRPVHAPGPDVAFVMAEPRDGLVGLTVAGERRLRQGAGKRWEPSHSPGMPSAAPEASAAYFPTDAAGWDGDAPVATLSSGEARRFALDLAWEGPAGLVLLDEPVEGLDAPGQALLVARLRAEAERGRSFVVADPTGALAGLAHEVIDLGSPTAAPLEPLPPPPPPALPVPGHGLPHAASASSLAAASVHVEALRIPGRLEVAQPLRFGPGFHALEGPNGGGKSTLLWAIAGLLPSGRRITVDGQPPIPGKACTLLLARARDHWSRATLAEELQSPPGRRDAASPASVLASFGLEPDLLQRHPSHLSSGQTQRAALAKAFAHPSRVLLLDEPESHLDDAGRRSLRDALASRVAQGHCILAATHDAAFAQLAHTRTRIERPASPARGVP